MERQTFNNSARTKGFSRSMVAFLAFLAIALFLLLSEHRIHALGYLPFLLLAACPLLHMYMHGGHGGHGGHSGRPGSQAIRRPGRPRDVSTEEII